MSLTFDRSATEDPRLLMVGNIPVDIVMRVSGLPGAGEDLLAESAVAHPGGGFNVLYGASRAGLKGRFAGTHGVGAFGDRVRTSLAAIGTSVLQPPTPDRDSGFVLVLVDATGERTFVTSPDAVVAYTEEMLSRARPTRSDLVYVSGYSLGLGEASAVLATWVDELSRDLLVFCDLGPRGATAGPDILVPVLGRVDWLSCNAREAAQLTGRAEPKAAAAELHRRTASAGVLVRAGRDGCWLVLPGSAPELVPAPAVGAAVDTNGAGDWHSGCFLAGLAEGSAPRESVVQANAAAASSVTRGGRSTAPHPRAH